jgi:hypothetical protein
MARDVASQIANRRMPPALSPLGVPPLGALIMLVGVKLGVLVLCGTVMAPDSSDYIAYADQILSGSLLHVDLVKEAIPVTLYRPIGYPAIIAGAKTVAEANWPWIVVLFQFAISAWATAMVYRLARLFHLGVWSSLGIAAAQATSLQFVLDQAIVSDSLCASTMTIAICLLSAMALRRDSPFPLPVLGAGALIAAAFLMRDVIGFVALGLAPLAAVTALRAPSRLRRVTTFALLFLPLISVQLAYREWNQSRVGAAVVTTVTQWTLLDSLVKASRYDSRIFSGASEIDQASREVVKSFALVESRQANEILHRDYGWSAVRIAHEVTVAYLGAWIHYPLAMLRNAFSFFSEAQLHQAVRPTETVRDLLLWTTGSDHDFARERSVRSGVWWMIPAVIAHRLFETISIAIFAAFILITPLRAARDGVTAETNGSLSLWFAYLVCLGLHAAVSFQPRYLSPVVATSIVVGGVNIAWLWAAYRHRQARNTETSLPGRP